MPQYPWKLYFLLWTSDSSWMYPVCPCDASFSWLQISGASFVYQESWIFLLCFFSWQMTDIFLGPQVRSHSPGLLSPPTSMRLSCLTSSGLASLSASRGPHLTQWSHVYLGDWGRLSLVSHLWPCFSFATPLPALSMPYCFLTIFCG